MQTPLTCHLIFYVNMTVNLVVHECHPLSLISYKQITRSNRKSHIQWSQEECKPPNYQIILKQMWPIGSGVSQS